MITRSVSGSPAAPSGTLARTIPNLRWYICGLLFFATTVNYIDRQVLGILKPVLEREFGWTESSFGWIVFGFQCAYAAMMPVAGRMIDWLGTRVGYALAVAVWSLASMSHALAGSATQFFFARFGLGIGESANFPAAIKTVAAWFPARERALATGIFNSGSNVGAIVAPLTVPFLALHFGWRSAFLATGSLDLIWLALWLRFFRAPSRHPRLSKKEWSLIQSDRAETERRISYRSLLRSRGAWAILIGKFLTDPVWWFYLYWLPGFLNRAYGLDLESLGPPLVAVYLSADVGSIGGGWISSRLLSRGRSITAARSFAMLLCALFVAPVGMIMFAGHHRILAVAVISLAAAAHQGWSANMYTLASDMFPKSAVGSVIGLAGFGGALGGMLVAPAIGYWLDWSDRSYGPIFTIAASMYLIAFGIMKLLAPSFEQARLHPVES